MSFRPSLSTTFLLITLVVVLLPVPSYAFGAGDIPDFAYLNDRAFRHGDIENILETLIKHAGAAALSGGNLFAFAKSVVKHASGGSKFSKNDIKKVYFGNWLRDYSQAMDIAGLSKLSADTLVLIVSVLGFMTFGFATEEFQVTADRLGVYLPVEHIDNPKGYAEKEGDARQYHPKLRPPVDPRELEFDDRTGMKNYMATEGQGWDTSTAFIRRTLRGCIEYGRRAGGQENADLWEAYRLLGTGLHTLEDLLAHSNWCEVALRKMGHNEVFCHVGDNVTVNTPNGRAPPLVTGTFGGADFIHSLLGEAGDKLSQASVTDLSQKMDDAAQGQNSDSKAETLKNLLSKLPSGGGENKMNEGEQIHEQAKAYQFNPDNIAPVEVQKQLLDLLKWRDSVMRDVISALEMVPGLTDLIEELTNALNAYVYTILAPYLGPILSNVTGILSEGSKAVINEEAQYEVFSNPSASDPSHSLLSKDHFGLILNEPAGKIAQVVVRQTVELIVPAWSNDSDIDQTLDTILEAFHHPYYATGRSKIQHDMYDTMEKWFGGLGSDEGRQVIEALTKESVRNNKNKRVGSEDQTWDEPGYGGCGHGQQGMTSQAQSKYSGGENNYSSQQGKSGGFQSKTSTYGGTANSSDDQRDSGRRFNASTRQEETTTQPRYNKPAYGESQTSSHENYGHSNDSQSGNTHQPLRTYGRAEYSGEDQPESGRRYNASTQQEETATQPRYNKPTYGESQFSSREDYGHSNDSRSGNTHQPVRTYGGRQHDDNESGYRASNTYEGSQHSRVADDSYESNRTNAQHGQYQIENIRVKNEHSASSAYQSRGEQYGGQERREAEQTQYLGQQYQESTERRDTQRRHRGNEGYSPSYGNSGTAGGYSSYGGGDEVNVPSRQRDEYQQDRNDNSLGARRVGGYQPSYNNEEAHGHGRREEDGTFGAEKLRIGRNSNDEQDGHRHHDGGRKHHEDRF